CAASLTVSSTAALLILFSLDFIDLNVFTVSESKENRIFQIFYISCMLVCSGMHLGQLEKMGTLSSFYYKFFKELSMDNNIKEGVINSLCMRGAFVGVALDLFEMVNYIIANRSTRDSRA
ncbi:hypothetical protein ACJX0J_011998, partial [Zea mays]